MLINAGVRRVFYCEGYEDSMADEMASEAGMELIHLPGEGDEP
jgi:hypothetical protein